MRRLPLLGILLALSMALTLAMAACGGEKEPAASPEPTAAAAGFPVTVTRSDGRELTIAQAPQRIASLSPAATEVLYAVGAGPQIVATDLQSDYPAEAANTTKLDAFQPDPESIAAVEADLIIVATNQDDIVQALDGLGETVLFLEVPDNIDGVMEQVRLLASVSGHA
jgi:iron complex transport system substrate-binding protein